MALPVEGLNRTKRQKQGELTLCLTTAGAGFLSYPALRLGLQLVAGPLQDFLFL